MQMRLRLLPVLCSLLAVLPGSPALADPPKVPKQRLPPEVVSELKLLEYQFSRALAQDCAPERCFSKGCVYVAHTVVEEAARGSMPGLQLESPPTDVPRQIFLTTAECGFAHEPSVSARDARALAARLKAKVSRAWTQVEVTAERLQPLPRELAESPEFEEPPEPDAGVPPVPQNSAAAADAGPALTAWKSEVALRELWLSLLPHFSWMIALFLVTLAALVLIWALRRLGRESPEEQALLAQLIAGGEAKNPAAGEGSSGEGDAAAAARLAGQKLAWQRRLAHREGDGVLAELVADLLRSGEQRMLAKAFLLFPEELARAFPREGSLASAKLELAEFIKHVDPASLPSDEVFFERLERHALAASLTAQQDTDLIRSLHDDFGTRALVQLVGVLPPRSGALLFALAPDALQHEAVGLLGSRQLAGLVAPLLRSNRMDPRESRHLLQVLGALRAGEPLPPAPRFEEVSDRGTEFGAAAALSILLPRLEPELRRQLVEEAADHLNGRLPGWVGETLYGEMLLQLDAPTRNDLLLEVEPGPLAAWLQLQTPAAEAGLLEEAPQSLRAALSGVALAASPEDRHALAHEGRRALAAALRRRLGVGADFRTLV